MEEELDFDDVFGQAVYSATSPEKKTFLPWHKPRKQFVRIEQWCTQVTRLMGDLTGGASLTYLGLPGVDLLDLRVLHDRVCAPQGREIRFLGFNYASRPSANHAIDMNIAIDEVRKLEFVEHRSEIVWDEFWRIVENNSLAWRKVREAGPFDVINLDLCDGFAAVNPDDNAQRRYDAMKRLFDLQARRKDPWLLFLTTRIGREFIHPAVQAIFKGLYEKNLESCPEFLERSDQAFSISSVDTLREAVEEDDVFAKTMGVALAKWIVGCAHGQQPPCMGELTSLFGYRVLPAASCEDIYSFAFRFEPLIGHGDDPAGLHTNDELDMNECGVARYALSRAAALANIDEILESDADLNTRMIQSTAEFLRAARYDSDEYLLWLANEA